MKICDAAAQVLKETDNDAVMIGDNGLLDLIAQRAGCIRDGDSIYSLHKRILGGLSRCPGLLIPGKTLYPGSRRQVRIFRLRSETGAE